MNEKEILGRTTRNKKWHTRNGCATLKYKGLGSGFTLTCVLVYRPAAR
jgi:hypothetical protein